MELLEVQQGKLINALREMHRRAVEDDCWRGDPLKNLPKGYPLTHDMLDALGQIGNKGDEDDKFEANLELAERSERLNEAQQKLSEREEWVAQREELVAQREHKFLGLPTPPPFAIKAKAESDFSDAIFEPQYHHYSPQQYSKSEPSVGQSPGGLSVNPFQFGGHEQFQFTGSPSQAPGPELDVEYGLVNWPHPDQAPPMNQMPPAMPQATPLMRQISPMTLPNQPPPTTHQSPSMDQVALDRRAHSEQIRESLRIEAQISMSQQRTKVRERNNSECLSECHPALHDPLNVNQDLSWPVEYEGDYGFPGMHDGTSGILAMPTLTSGYP